MSMKRKEEYCASARMSRKPRRDAQPFLELPADPFRSICSFLIVEDLLNLEETSSVIRIHLTPPIWADLWTELQKETKKKDHPPILGWERFRKTPTKRPYPGVSPGVTAKELFFREHARRVRARREEVSVVLTGLMRHQHGWVFNVPVDPVALDLPDYFDIIDNPMDYGTIREKLDGNEYESYHQVADDIHLVTDNAMVYNPEGSVVYDMAAELRNKADLDLKKIGLA